MAEYKEDTPPTEKEKQLSRIIVDAMTKRFTMIERNDLYLLARVAFLHEEISMGKAAELLGIPLEDFRHIAAGWAKEQDKSDVILPE
jgi:hypothetical protein